VEQMAEDADKPENQPDFASVEVDLFGALFGFYEKTVPLLRQSSLGDTKLKLLGERIKLVMQNITDDMKRSPDLNLAGRLDSAYEEIRCFAEELSCKEGGKMPKLPERDAGA
jgi:hypothetical protein